MILPLVVGLLLSSCGSTSNLPTAPSLLSAVQTNSKLSTILSLVQLAGGLEGLLEGRGDHTIFAPSNTAIQALGEQTIADLKNPDNRSLLVSVLKGHIVNDDLNPEDVMGANNLENLEGKNLTVNQQADMLMVGGAQVLESIKTKEGFVHVIDRVIRN